MPTLMPLLSMVTSSYVLRREFRTDIIMTRSGREQRRALRGFPRRTIDLTSVLKGERHTLFNRFMNVGQRTSVYLADETRFARPESFSAVTPSFEFDPIPEWLYAGQRIVIFEGTRLEYNEIESNVGNTFNLATATTGWTSNAVVYPALVGWLSSEQQHSTPWFRTAVPAVRFAESPGTAVLNGVGDVEPDVPATETFNSREVFLFTPNKWDDIEVTHITPREDIDYGQGLITPFDVVGFTSQLRRVAYTMHRDDSEFLSSMFRRMRGQQGEFYMPTFENDLPPRVQANSGTAILEVEGTDVHTYYNGSTIYKGVAVFLDDGRIPSCLFNRVTSMATVGGHTQLTMANNWSQNIPVGTKISWMPVWRFATDIMEMEWVYNPLPQMHESVRCRTTFRVLEDL